MRLALLARWPRGSGWRGLLLALAFAAALLPGCSGRVELVAAVAEAEANEALAALLAAGVQAEKVPAKDGLVGLHVAQGQVAQAVDVLKARGLPRERHAGMGEVFRKEGLISSPLEERARYVFALSQELSGTLSRLDGVIVARVHVVLPERVAPGEPVQPSSASVFLKVQSPFDEELLVPRVKRLVMTSIPGLTDEAGARKLSVVLVPTKTAEAPRMDWQQVGPFMVESSSADGLRTVALAMFVIIVILGALMMYFGGHYALVIMARRKIKNADEKRARDASKKPTQKAAPVQGSGTSRSTDPALSVG